MDLCFIRERVADAHGQPFAQIIDDQLRSLFPRHTKWSLEPKQADGLDYVIAEVTGIGAWEKDEDILAYLEERAAHHFWAWLQGYRLQVEVKEHAECSHCGKNKVKAGAL
ncbi:hypothetical protein NLX71_12050 [Paenibacillus sp. MZ04-78.2]|uniref:hypothetical protein n=1 Tax=Paenibacillus sp. MZ04-78.2 TaxID=2962034 RepID=UPI0020B8F2C0|nr:hypothetical protein [Paenibacillus sp. MZ04-78.2]MCP3774035.1 hypothetical protein [Paenibacillus sp. MZ04-78.2]